MSTFSPSLIVAPAFMNALAMVSIDDVRGVEGRTLDDDRNDIDRKND